MDKNPKTPLITDFSLGAYYDMFKKMTLLDYRTHYGSQTIESVQASFESDFCKGNSLIEKMEQLDSIYLQDYKDTLQRIPHIDLDIPLPDLETNVDRLYHRQKVLLNIYLLRSQMYQELLNNEIVMRNERQKAAVACLDFSTRDYEQIAYEIEEKYSKKIEAAL